MPNQRVGDPGDRGSTSADLAEAAGPGSVDRRHLLLVGAGPGLGMAVARRFAAGGYQVTRERAARTASATSPAPWPIPVPRSTPSRPMPAIPMAWAPG